LSVKYEDLIRVVKETDSNPDIIPDLIRAFSVIISGEKATPHLGSVLSCAEILASAKKISLDHNGEIKVLLSKGHAALGLYVYMFIHGQISIGELLTFAESDSIFEEHPNPKVPGIDFPSGSLGHGLGLMSGFIAGSRIQNKSVGGIVIMSDGECNEGTVWEAALFAKAKNLAGLVAIIDSNGWQATGQTSETYGTNSLKAMFEGFGWNGVVVDGHKQAELLACIHQGLGESSPFFIVAETVKGKGVSFMEDDNNWHYRIPSESEVQLALAEILGRLQ
jgi:transketolase